VVNNLEPKDRDIAMVFQNLRDFIAYDGAARISGSGCASSKMSNARQGKAQSTRLAELHRYDAASGPQTPTIVGWSSASASPLAAQWCAIRPVFLFDDRCRIWNAPLRTQMRLGDQDCTAAVRQHHPYLLTQIQVEASHRPNRNP